MAPKTAKRSRGRLLSDYPDRLGGVIAPQPEAYFVGLRQPQRLAPGRWVPGPLNRQASPAGGLYSE